MVKTRKKRKAQKKASTPKKLLDQIEEELTKQEKKLVEIKKLKLDTEFGKSLKDLTVILLTLELKFEHLRDEYEIYIPDLFKLIKELNQEKEKEDTKGFFKSIVEAVKEGVREGVKSDLQVLHK